MKKIFTCLFILVACVAFAQPSGCFYNQPLTVTDPNVIAGVDYQLKITVNTQSLILAGKMNSTGSDIRFGSTCTGTTLLNYWIESGINTANTVIWVKIPSLPSSTFTIVFMFFGNH